MSRKSILVAAAITCAVSFLGIRPAAALGPNCPGVNPYLNDANPSPTCRVYGPSLTLENRVPAVLERKPAYGFFPATCIIVSHRWDTGVNINTNQLTGTLTGSGRVVQDNGNCTGPTVATNIQLFMVPHFYNIYGVGGPYNFCHPSAANNSGAVTATITDATCSGHAYAGIYDDWERGYYRVDYNLTTGNGQWHISSTHQLY